MIQIVSLKDVSAEMRDGSIFGLIGSNGSGKSTLLRIMCGVFDGDTGDVMYDGADVWENTRVKEQLVYLSDEQYFTSGGTISEMRSLYRSVYPTFSVSRYKHLLELFGLDEKRKVNTFSKGMQRQAGLILALSTAPEYLFLDETFDGLDFVRRRLLAAILRRFTEKRNACVIVTSHYLNELEKFADSLALIEDGRMIIPDTGGATLEEYFMAHTEVRADEIDTLF